jgi:hypothetical protein
MNVVDRVEPTAGALPSITRNFQIRGSGEVWYLAAAADSISEKNDGYIIGGSMLRVSFTDLGGNKPVIRENNNRKELLIKLNVDGRTTLKQHYEWNL